MQVLFRLLVCPSAAYRASFGFELVCWGAGGRCVYLLEGGYDLKALGEAVAETFRGSLGLPSADKFDPALLRDEPLDKLKTMLAETRRIHGL